MVGLGWIDGLNLEYIGGGGGERLGMSWGWVGMGGNGWKWVGMGVNGLEWVGMGGNRWG